MESLRSYLAYLDRGCRFTQPPRSQEEKIRVLLGDDVLVEFLESDNGLGATTRDMVRARLLDEEDYDVNLRIVFYSRYRTYCDDVGTTPLSKNAFFQRIDTVYGVKAGNKVRIYRWDYEIPGTKYTDDRNFAQVRRFIDAELKEAKQDELRTVRTEQSAGAMVQDDARSGCTDRHSAGLRLPRWSDTASDGLHHKAGPQFPVKSQNHNFRIGPHQSVLCGSASCGVVGCRNPV